MNPTAYKLMLYVAPVVSCICTCPISAAVQLSFASSAVFTVFQIKLIHHKQVRYFFKIQPFPPRAGPPAQSPYKGALTILGSSSPTTEQPPAPKGYIDGAISEVKGAASQVMKTARDLKEKSEVPVGRQRLTKTELKRAEAYEAQRRREMAQEKLDNEADPDRPRLRRRSVR